MPTPPAPILSAAEDALQQAQRAEALLQRDAGEALSLAREAAAHAHMQGDNAGRAHALFVQGIAHAFLTEFELATVALEAAVEALDGHANDELLGRCVTALGMTCLKRGQFGNALHHFHRSLQHAREHGLALNQARVLGNLGLLHSQIGEHDKALQLHREALALAESQGHAVLSCTCAESVVGDLVQLSRHDEALRAAQHWAGVARAHEFALIAACLDNKAGACLTQLGRAAEGAPLLQASLPVIAQGGEKEVLGISQVHLGDACVALGRADEGERLYRDALALADSADVKHLAVRAHAALMVLLEDQQRYREALAHAKQRLQVERALGAERASRRAQLLAVEMEVARFEHQAAIETARRAALEDANQALHRMQQRLEHDASHDALSGLFNRRHFMACMERLVQARGAEEGGAFCVAFIDLDGFKPVNDRFGHHAGDALLAEVARRVRRVTRADDMAARVGGDEFTVVFDHLREREAALANAKRLLAAVRAPFAWQGRRIRVSASIGLALFPLDGPNAEALMHAADEAMYRAKRGGKNAIVFAGASS